jgi:hypothetical protein
MAHGIITIAAAAEVETNSRAQADELYTCTRVGSTTLHYSKNVIADGHNLSQRLFIGAVSLGFGLGCGRNSVAGLNFSGDVTRRLGIFFFSVWPFQLCEK